MKQSILSALLTLALTLLAACGGNAETHTPVTTPVPTPEASVEYHSDEFGFSIDIPDEYEDIVDFEIQRNPNPEIVLEAIVLPDEFISEKDLFNQLQFLSGVVFDFAFGQDLLPLSPETAPAPGTKTEPAAKAQPAKTTQK